MFASKGFKVATVVVATGSLAAVSYYQRDRIAKFARNWKKPTEKDNTYRYLVVDFDTFFANHKKVSETMLPGLKQSADEKAQGPIAGFEVTGETLQVIKDALGDDSKYVHIGLIKGTKEYGTTSVTMGAAVDYLSQHPNQTKVVFLNSGTGGIKFQLAESKNGIISLPAESKDAKEGEDVPSPNALVIGNYKPKKHFPFPANSKLMKEKLAEFLKENNLPSDTPVFGFVTGSVREKWEEANGKDKAQFDNTMNAYFEGSGVLPLKNGGSYFIEQDGEGTYELRGTRCMYANLVKVGLLDEECEVVGSFGIGRGSTQWMIRRSDGTEMLIGHKAGMDKLDALKTLPGVVKKQLTSETVEQVRSSVKGKKAVIAVKSGAALLIERNEDVRKQMTTPMVVSQTS
jgi:hypothetical protein